MFSLILLVAGRLDFFTAVTFSLLSEERVTHLLLLFSS
jgi:hypothetical protein